MKLKIILLLTTITGIVWIECIAQKKKVAYEFPEAMAKPVQAEFAKQCDKGLILYQINCSRCHDIPQGKTSIIPDFTPEQLVGYELRVLNPKHESDLPETNVSAEELGQITTFLTYKKKSGIPLKAKDRTATPAK
jgi:hypothetical protein